MFGRQRHPPRAKDQARSSAPARRSIAESGPLGHQSPTDLEEEGEGRGEEVNLGVGGGQHETFAVGEGAPTLELAAEVHHLAGGALLHHAMRDLARRLGPLMLLRLGKLRVLVASSADAARDIMRANDLAFSTRPLLRRRGRVRSFRAVREEEARRLLRRRRGSGRCCRREQRADDEEHSRLLHNTWIRRRGCLLRSRQGAAAMAPGGGGIVASLDSIESRFETDTLSCGVNKAFKPALYPQIL